MRDKVAEITYTLFCMLMIAGLIFLLKKSFSLVVFGQYKTYGWLTISAGLFISTISMIVFLTAWISYLIRDRRNKK